jgi:Holliday junction resolvasome RuvABC endonuclease subunit
VFSDLPVSQYTALQMKQAVVGWGRASKGQIQEMVKRLPGPDAAAALALAITHAHAHAHAHADKAIARLALADGVIGADKGKHMEGRSW